MAAPLSRRKLAVYAAGLIAKGNGELAIEQLAAYLVETNRTREAGLVVRDIEFELANNGIVIATVSTAHGLTADLRAAVARLLQAKQLFLKEVVDPSVIGGIRIVVPGKQYDATVRRKLELLNELTLI